MVSFVWKENLTSYSEEVPFLWVTEIISASPLYCLYIQAPPTCVRDEDTAARSHEKNNTRHISTIITLAKPILLSDANVDKSFIKSNTCDKQRQVKILCFARKDYLSGLYYIELSFFLQCYTIEHYLVEFDMKSLVVEGSI